MVKGALLLIAVAVGAVSPTARAGVFSVPLGSALPPMQFAGYELRPAPLDRSPLFQSVARLPLAFGFEAEASSALTHRRIGAGWAEWGHGYDGDVYTTDGASSIELFPDPGVHALVVYIDALPFSRLRIDAGLEDGPVASQFAADGAGPVGFLFFSPGDESLPSIRIECDAEFALGQLFTAIPAPGALTPFAASMLGLVRRARR